MAEGDQSDDAQKTEEPTPKRLEEARKKGQVPLSREVNHWVMLLAATILIMSLADSVFSDLLNFMTLFIARAHDISGDVGGIGFALGESVRQVFKILALPFIVLMIAAFLAPFAQVGPIFSAKSIMPSFDKISPVKGLGRLFSKRALMEFGKGILKLAIVGTVGTLILSPYFGAMDHMVGLPIPLLLDELQSMASALMMGVLVVLVIVAVIDLVYQRKEHYKKMRMTKQEVKEEHKQAEGDPHVRARLRGLRAERSRQRMIQNVPEADVVITNPTHYSIALKYDPDNMAAPVCVAKGIDEIALRIREVATEHDVILYENKPLARTLFDVVEVDDVIPEEHFKAVAEVISFVFKQKGKMT